MRELSFGMIIILKSRDKSLKLQVCKMLGVLQIFHLKYKEDVDLGKKRLNPVFWSKCFSIAGVLVLLGSMSWEIHISIVFESFKMLGLLKRVT
jgi:hypothetical protein